MGNASKRSQFILSILPFVSFHTDAFTRAFFRAYFHESLSPFYINYNAQSNLRKNFIFNYIFKHIKSKIKNGYRSRKISFQLSDILNCAKWTLQHVLHSAIYPPFSASRELVPVSQALVNGTAIII